MNHTADKGVFSTSENQCYITGALYPCCQIWIGFGSLLLGLAQLAIALHLILSGDVELNPGPLDDDVEAILAMVANKAFEEDDWNVIIEECSTLAYKWEQISASLGLAPSLIASIRGNHPCDNIGCWNDALLQWIQQKYNIQRFGEPSWKTLLKAIAKVDKLRFKKMATDHQVCHVHCTQDDKNFKVIIDNKIKQKSTVSSSQGAAESAILNLKPAVKEQLCSKSEDMTYNFQKLFKATRNSLNDRNISVADLLHHIECLGCLKPTYDDLDLPPLRHQLPGLAKAETVDTVMSVVKDYCSFFNYRMLEHIIEEFGTEEDQANLAKYKEKFKAYAECCVFECPIDVGTISEEGHANMFVTLDDSFEGCTLSHVNSFFGNLRKILNIPSDVGLKLCRISPGSLKLIFQMLQFFLQAIFPLSNDQEAALADLGVVHLSCGDYQFNLQIDSEVTSLFQEIEDIATCGDSSPYQSDSEESVDTYYADLALMPAIKVPVWKKKAISIADSGIGSSSIVSGSTAGQIQFSSDLVNRDLDDLDIQICQNAADSSNLLLKAAQKGDIDMVTQFIENKLLNPLQEDKHGQNALHLAARGGHLQVMKYLSEERGHNPASQGFIGRTAGWTPLHHAAVCNQLEMVKYLVHKQQVDPICQTKDGSTPLHLACVGGDIKVVVFLVREMNKYLPLKDIVDCKNDDGAAPIHTAALCGHLEVVKYLTIELKCDPNTVTTGGSNRKFSGRIALHHAAQKGHFDTVKFLVEQQNCNPSHMDDCKVTPLHKAAQAGHLNIVQYLTTEQHCNILCTNSANDTPLHHAARCGHLEVVKFFVESLHCLPNIQGQCNKTPLEQAKNRGHHHVVRYLAARC